MSASTSGNSPTSKLDAGLAKFVGLALLIIGMAVAPAALAQSSAGLDTLRIVEEASIAQGQLIADRDENRDVNGRLAAGLIIQTDLSGLTFQANQGVIKRVDRPGEYLLFLSPDERRVSVYREGFSPFQLVLSDAGIRLRSGQVWKIAITGDKEIVKTSVNFIIQPGSVAPTLRIDGSEQEQYEGIPLALGEHVVQIQAGGFDSITDTIEVSESNTLFRYTMERVAPQLITITTRPENAEAELGGEALGATPVEKIFKSPGQYTLRVTKEGFLPVEEQITIEKTDDPNQVQTFNINLPKNSATILLDVAPEEAVVELNGSRVNYTQPIDFPGGDLLMEVRAEGYRTVTETFNAARGDTVRKSIQLEEVYGSFQFSSDPLTANITLKRNGEEVDSWRGPNYFSELRVGTYTVEAEAPDYLPVEQEVIIREDDLAEVKIEMRPKDGISRLSVSGIPGEAKISISGANGSIKEDALPVSETSLQFGTYNINVRKKGFKPITHQVKLDEPQESVNLMDQFEPKSKGTAVAMMLLIPGGGQFYMGKSGRGLLYLAASGAAVYYTISSIGTLQTEVEAYNDAVGAYQSASSNFGELWDRIDPNYSGDNLYSAKEDAKQQVLLGVGAFLGVRVIELFDNLLTPSPQKELEAARLNLRTGATSVTMQYNF